MVKNFKTATGGHARKHKAFLRMDPSLTARIVQPGIPSCQPQFTLQMSSPVKEQKHPGDGQTTGAGFSSAQAAWAGFLMLPRRVSMDMAELVGAVR